MPSSPHWARGNGKTLLMVRADHVAGAAFVLLGLLVFVLGVDLPFGDLNHPGAGMMPKLVAGLMIVLALAIFATAGASRPLSAIDWSDRWHAALLVAITGAAVALYQTLGFLITMALLVFALLTLVERRRWAAAAIYAVSLSLFGYWLFGIALKAPLERGLLWF